MGFARALSVLRAALQVHAGYPAIPLGSRDRTTDPFSLSGTAAGPLAGVASVPLSFFLLGATGRTGSRFLSQALARDHGVTA